jgi:hypothetical protein
MFWIPFLVVGKNQNVMIQLSAGNPTTLRQIQELKRGDWIQVQGYSAQGLPHEDGVFKQRWAATLHYAIWPLHVSVVDFFFPGIPVVLAHATHR